MRWHKRQQPRDWRRWFAWYPVLVDAQWIWLEHVERRPFYGYEFVLGYHYRLLEEP